MSTRFLCAAALLAACGTPSNPPAEEAPTQGAAQAPAEAPPVEEAASKHPTPPSPREIQQTLKASGIETSLASLIPARTLDVDSADPDRAAIRTGVVLADMILSVNASEKAVLLTQLDTIDKGMTQLNGGSDIDRTLDEIKDSVANDAVTREELVSTLDELSQVVIPELEFNNNDRIVPLIQAGSWLEGTHLVSQALKGVENKSAAEGILKSPEVVSYFTEYATKEVPNRRPEVITPQLIEALNTLSTIASKTEPLTDEDLTTVVKVTGDVMGMLEK